MENPSHHPKRQPSIRQVSRLSFTPSIPLQRRQVGDSRLHNQSTDLKTARGDELDGYPAVRPTRRQPFANGSEEIPFNHLIPATLHLHSQAHNIHVPIDTGCLQVNIISAKIAALLAKDGGPMYGTNIVLTAGVGGQSYGMQGVINVTALKNTYDEESV